MHPDNMIVMMNLPNRSMEGWVGKSLLVGMPQEDTCRWEVADVHSYSMCKAISSHSVPLDKFSVAALCKMSTESHRGGGWVCRRNANSCDAISLCGPCLNSSE